MAAPHVDRMATALAAEMSSHMVEIKAAAKGVLFTDSPMEEASDEEELSEEQHAAALDREMSEVYLKDYDGGIDKCFDAKYMTLYEITDTHSLHLSPRFDPVLRKDVDKWLASGTQDRPRKPTCTGMKKIRAELYRIREAYARDKRKVDRLAFGAKEAAEEMRERELRREIESSKVTVKRTNRARARRSLPLHV